MFLRLSNLILFLFLLQKSYSQSAGGRVLENNRPLAAVNISLLKASDSTLVKTAVTDEKGLYEIQKPVPGLYILQASRAGYKKQIIAPVTIDTGNAHTEFPVILLAPAAVQLGEVTVMGKRPFIEQKIDRTVVNVANSIVAAGSTALEVLEKAPGITIDRQNDQIIFRGKEGVIVQIDGKQSYLSVSDVVSMLRSLPADNIDRIELITNPSAKYDAAGNSGIIDIRLKKNNNTGTNGLLTAGLGYGRYGRQRAGLQINHRSTRYNVFGSYNTAHEGNYRNFNLSRVVPDGNQSNFIDQDSYIRFKSSGHNAKAGLDFFINKKTTAGIVWTGFWDRSYETSPAYANFRRQADTPVYFQTLTGKSLLNIQSNHLFNMNLVRAVPGKGQWSADIDVGKFRRSFNNLLSTQTLIPDSATGSIASLLSVMPANIDIFSMRSDYNKPMGNNWKTETGIKISQVRSDNDMRLSTGTDGNLVKDSVLSNHFKYAENVYAAYISFSGKLNKQTDVLLGVRMEYTQSTGNSITLHNMVTKKYLNVFPSIFISRPLNKNNTLHFSYSYRIDRPNYQSLNPARSYIDPYAYSSGNPFLAPSFTHSLEIKHGYKNKLFTSAGASFTSDLVFFVVQPVDPKTTQRMPENIGTAQAFYLTMSFPFTVLKGWAMQNTLTGTYSQFQYRYKTIPLRSQQISARLNNSHTFIFGKGWTGEMTARISSPSVNALVRSPWLGAMDLGLQKSFLRNWKAKFILQDIWHTNYFKGKINAPEFYSSVWISSDSRIAMLTITFSFGNQQLKSGRQRKTAAEEEIQRTN